MLLNVKRKVREINLKANEFLLPLFEVIVNAIHAIQDKKIDNGLIQIDVIRDHTQQQLEGFEGNFPIKSFIVKDNGIGFTKEAFQAFNQAYTDYKLVRGGKGVGRFTVLGAFDLMEVESTFQEGEDYLERKFIFSVESEVEQLDEPNKVTSQKSGSIVHLKSYQKEFF